MPPTTSLIPLNLMDRVQWELHRILKRVNGCGNILQFGMQWKGAIDRELLQAGLDRLKRTYPLLTARMTRSWFVGHGWSWKTDPTRDLPLQVHTLKTGQPLDSLLVELIHSCGHPTESNPIEFHLIELDDHNEFLVIQWCHGLMDGKAVEFLAGDLDRMMSGDETIEPEEYSDEILERIRRISLPERIRLARRTLRELEKQTQSTMRKRGSLRSLGKTMVLERRTFDLTSLDEPRETRIAMHNLSTTLAACGLKAIHDLKSETRRDSGLYQTDLPVSLRAFGKQRPICRNLMSRFRLQCRDGDFDDLPELIRRFDGQVRQQLSGQREVGTLILLRVAALNVPLLRIQLKKFCTKELSLGYSNMGPIAPGLKTFQGRPVTGLHSIAIPWTTGGLVMTAHQIGARLFVSSASIEEIVPRKDLLNFLDRLERHLKTALNLVDG